MSTLTANGGFCAPRYLTLPVEHPRLVRETLPVFRAFRGIDFRPSHVRWAEERERELSAARKLWPWPEVPEVAR